MDEVSEKLKDQVICLFADIFGLRSEEISLDSSRNTIRQWDSFQHLNLLLALEQKYGVYIEPEESEQLVNLKEIIKLLKSKGVDIQY